MTYGHGDDAYKYSDIRLDFSSNIYSASDMSELKAHLCANINLIDHYPEPEARALERLVAAKRGVSPDEVLVTSGATDAIYLVAQAAGLLGCSGYALGPLPTFSEYADASRMFGLSRRKVNDACSGTVLWLCNPNNPTGSIYSEEEIRDYAGRYALVVVDQSYEGYSLEPVMSPAKAAGADNIIQIHSFTKEFAIPGLRVGYVVSNASLVARLRRLLRPWSVNALAVEAARWLINHDLHAITDLRSYLAETQRLRRQLDCIEGISTDDTSTNFFLATVAPVTAAQFKESLATQYHILIRDASNFDGLTQHHFRIAARSRADNECLVAAVASCLSQW